MRENEKAEVLYIDCDGSFSIERFAEMAQNTLMQMNKNITEPNIKSLLSRLKYKRALDHIELDELFSKAPMLLKKREQVKLLIIDSFATHYRSVNDWQFNKIGNNLGLELNKLAKKFNIAVVVTNIQTTEKGFSGPSVFKEIFGDYFAVTASNKICLGKGEGSFLIEIDKSSIQLDEMIGYSIQFKITKKGIELIY
eukprot:TRINITY_DN3544_c0_g1_i3.p1 TRINITY_DN3544_c0_g1~~TRINITY_DN3544_c0_g1_i3.p1  ORF type:complete len:196 (-),score=22.60 TRINITY_DN3544_c0_g1_i3:123-710(-)